MTRVLYRISRTACPVADRPWLDALFAESVAVASGPARFVWLLGAWGLLFDRHVRRLDPRLLLAAAILPRPVARIRRLLVHRLRRPRA